MYMGNIQGSCRKFLGHFAADTVRIIQTGSYPANKAKMCTESEFYHICVFQYAHFPFTVDLDIVSE